MLKSILSRAALVAAALSLGLAPAGAQIRTVDPNTAIDADLDREAVTAPPSQSEPSTGEDVYYDTAPVTPAQEEAMNAPADATSAAPAANAAPAATAATTYKQDDLFAAAEGVFGKGAKGLGELLQKILKDQGEPNAYIAGREAGGAFVVGLRYGSGTMTHKVEGQRPVYWTGPSVGFDAGANAGQTFVLVYNLHDSQELYQRFPAGEGNAYFVGGLTASYMRSGDIVLIPIRLGVGLRLGANVGYMKFTEKQRWLPL